MRRFSLQRSFKTGYLLLLVACSQNPQFIASGSSSADFEEREVSAVIATALADEAAGISTDTLFMPSARIVVNGRNRTESPLFAGIGTGGQVAISSSQMEVRPNSSWGLVEYRWESRDGAAREGRATFVLTQVAPGQWRIQHVHSSSPQ